MPLTEHLRELRGRLVKSMAALVLGSVAGWFLYNTMFGFLVDPFMDVVEESGMQGQDVQLALTGIADPFVIQLQLSMVFGVLLSSPIWLLQLWRFITPALHRNERMWAVLFVSVSAPLFLGGAYLGFRLLPYGLSVLLGFTPNGVVNIIGVDRYLSFLVRTVLVFGIGFLAPVVVVLANFAGVLSGSLLARSWRWIVVSIALFAAVATPTGDPINMLLLAAPVAALMGIALAICVLNDRRRARRHRRVAVEDLETVDASVD